MKVVLCRQVRVFVIGTLQTTYWTNKSSTRIGLDCDRTWSNTIRDVIQQELRLEGSVTRRSFRIRIVLGAYDQKRENPTSPLPNQTKYKTLLWGNCSKGDTVAWTCVKRENKAQLKDDTSYCFQDTPATCEQQGEVLSAFMREYRTTSLKRKFPFSLYLL